MIVLAHLIHDAKHIVLLEDGIPTYVSRRRSREQYTVEDACGWWLSTRIALFKHVFSALYADGEKALFQWGNQIFDMAAVTFHKSDHLFIPAFGSPMRPVQLSWMCAIGMVRLLPQAI